MKTTKVEIVASVQAVEATAKRVIVAGPWDEGIANAESLFKDPKFQAIFSGKAKRGSGFKTRYNPALHNVMHARKGNKFVLLRYMFVPAKPGGAKAKHKIMLDNDTDETVENSKDVDSLDSGTFATFDAARADFLKKYLAKYGAKATAAVTEANLAHRSRMRDVRDEENNKNDIIGTLLRGDDWTIKVLVTYNRQNNTYYMNYNSTIIPEDEIAFGVWQELTDLGSVKIRNLLRHYAEKMPQRLRELERKLNAQPTPTATDMLAKGFVPLPVAHHHRGPLPADPDVLLEYDLDNVHLSSTEVKAFKTKMHADIDPTSDDPFVQQHNYLEETLGQVGFTFVESKVKTAQRYVYAVQFKAMPLNEIDLNDGHTVEEITNSLRLITNTIGWPINEASFPLRTNAGYVWMASGGGIALTVDTAQSTVEFTRL